ncbi:hypothetical protein FB565_008467 [Actinoplanes lutulentus]|nr:hypothetical protein [Actinoplanes lutulentus]MBB2948684.1 hypothetical protein [Actinoplanes lutulentus]
MAAYFEVLDNLLPDHINGLARERSEQVARVMGKRADAAYFAKNLQQQLIALGGVLPLPQDSPGAFDARMLDVYTELAELTRLIILETVTEDEADEIEVRRALDGLSRLPSDALDRYQELFRQLMADFPEVGFWANKQEHLATRAALAGLEEQLRAISTGRAPDQRRESLALAYRAELRRPVVESGDVPDGIAVPWLEDAYLPHRFRVADVPASGQVSEEAWWSTLTVRDDLQEFLIGHLTSPQAIRAPLLVLGQPGSGKSVLTKVFAARLPAADFLPIRVVLRDTPTSDDLQDQIEYAIRSATGERVEWPALSRSAGDAMPVILLDGFDELLQAAGVSQTDYLDRVARFQRREAEQHRPVAVVVTSRTAVADRARPPAGTVALRLEPFADDQVTTWLDIWNTVNAGDFATRRLQPLTAETVLVHRALAEQPLLLLMLALYDADGNALRRQGTHLSAHELYEQLLRSFAIREIAKHRPGLTERDLTAAVENELRRLSVVAFAMFNRAAQWVTETDLDADFTALPIRGPQGSPSGTGSRTPLTSADLTLGRFFFIHQARALRDKTRLQTYEFLHATFGEFLVARLVHQVLLDMVAKEQASTMSFSGGPAEDDLLRALLSFQPLTARTPILEFLSAMPVPDGSELLIRLFRDLDHTPPGHRFADYRPQSPGEPARYAAYGANLLLLILATAGEIRASDLFTEQNRVEAWRRKVTLWRSQLSSDSWSTLVLALKLERVHTDGRRDVRLTLGAGWSAQETDLAWTFESVVGDRQAGHWEYREDQFRRAAYLQCDPNADIMHHALTPVLDALPGSVGGFFVRPADQHAQSPAHLLQQLWVSPSPGAYLTLAEHNTQRDSRFGALLLDRLATDPDVSPHLATHVIGSCQRRELASRMCRCALAFLGRGGRDIDVVLAGYVRCGFALNAHALDRVLTAEAVCRLHELDLEVPAIRELHDRAAFDELISEVATRRPDLVTRLEAVWRHPRT